jgi:rRNA maturation endonuclease Nob1
MFGIFKAKPKPQTYTIVCNLCGHKNVTTDPELRKCANCGGHVYATKNPLVRKGK